MSAPSWEDAFSSLETPEPSTEERSPVGFPKKYSLERALFGEEGGAKQTEQKQALGYGLKKFFGGLTGLPEALVRSFSTEGPGKQTQMPSFEEGFEKLAGQEFPEPENVPGQIAGKGLEFFGSMMSLGGPIKGGPKIGALPRNLLSIFVPAGVATVAEKSDLPPWAQAAATLGTSFLMHRLTGSNLSTMKRDLYKKADELATGARIDVPYLDSHLGKLESSLLKGTQAPAESSVLTQVKRLREKIQDGWMGVDELTASKRSLESLTRADELKKDPGARKLLKGVKAEINRSLDHYSKNNPKWGKVYRQANSLHKGMETTKGIFDFLKKNFAKAAGGELFLKLFLPSLVKPSVTGLPAAQSAAFIWSLARNPGYRKAYWDVLKGAAKEDARATAVSLKKFEREAEKIGPVESSQEESQPGSWEEALSSIQ